jgi:hypothetical protein
VPARYWVTYLPRTRPFIDAKSYSGRISFADFRLSLFIEPSFVTCGSAGADDPDRVAFLRMHYHQDVAAFLISISSSQSALKSSCCKSAFEVRGSSFWRCPDGRERSDSGSSIGGHIHPVNRQSTASLLFRPFTPKHTQPGQGVRVRYRRIMNR